MDAAKKAKILDLMKEAKEEIEKHDVKVQEIKSASKQERAKK